MPQANPEEVIDVCIELIDAAVELTHEYAAKQIDELPDEFRTFGEIPEFRRLGEVLQKVAIVFQEEPAGEANRAV